MAKIKRNSELGRLAQALYEAANPQALDPCKFPKTNYLGEESAWVTVARAALEHLRPEPSEPGVGDVWQAEDGCPPDHVVELSDANPNWTPGVGQLHRLVRQGTGDSWRWESDLQAGGGPERWSTVAKFRDESNGLRVTQVRVERP